MDAKKYIITFFFSVIVFSMNAQERYRENIEKDIFGVINYSNTNNLQASLSKDIFDNLIFKDNKGNQITYSKEIYPLILRDFNNNEYQLMYWLVDMTRNLNNSKEKYSYDIFQYLQYENNNGMKATLSKDIFDKKIYSDSNNNEISYSQDIWTKVLTDFNNNEFEVFLWLMERCRNKKSIKEKNETDIFGHTQHSIVDNENDYKSSFGKDIFGNLEYKENGFKASIENDIFDDKIYKDSNGNQIKYTKEFIDLLKKKGIRFEDDNQLLNRLLRYCRNRKNYKEEYDVDIFGDIKYKQSNGKTITIKPEEYRHNRPK